MKKLADDQCSSTSKGSIYHIKYMSIQSFTIGVNWPGIGCLMEVSIMSDIYTYCLFTWLYICDLIKQNESKVGPGPKQNFTYGCKKDTWRLQIGQMLYQYDLLQSYVKGVCSDSQPYPPALLRHGTGVESFIVKWNVQNLFPLGEISKTKKTLLEIRKCGYHIS